MPRSSYGFVTPARRDRWPNFGLLALVVAAGGLLTGLFLALNYAPTLDAARDSVQYIESEVALGAFLRGLHHWAGNFVVALAFLHGLRVFWHGAYKAPRRMAWVLGCLLFLVLVGFAYTGYLLTGDERGYTALTVMDGISGSTPVVGEQVSAVLKGGPAISSATLTRIYVVHTMILPAALVLLVGAFIVVWRQVGPARHHRDITDDVAPAWPAALARDAVAATVVLVLLALAAWLLPPALGPKPDVGGAGSPDARPEWFLLWVNEALYIVPGAKFVVGGLLPGLFILLALALPFLGRGTSRAPGRRKPEIAVAGGMLLLIGLLTASSLARPGPAAEEEESEPPVEAADADVEAQVAQILRKFRCATCHVIDGDEDGGDTGPALNRESVDGRPPFARLFTREFFRAKVGNPLEYWPDTAMVYRKRAGLPSKEELDVLEKWFFR